MYCTMYHIPNLFKQSAMGKPRLKLNPMTLWCHFLKLFPPMLCNVSKNEEFIIFADVTNIFVKAKTEAETIDLANKILQNVSMYIVYVNNNNIN